MIARTYGVYVKTNDSGYITAVNSSAFLADTTGWTMIGEGEGDQYRHAQNHYFEQPVVTRGGAYRYKLVDGAPVECTAEDIAEQEAAKQSAADSPSQIDRIEAQVTYTAMMTDTLLEG